MKRHVQWISIQKSRIFTLLLSLIINAETIWITITFANGYTCRKIGIMDSWTKEFSVASVPLRRRRKVEHKAPTSYPSKNMSLIEISGFSNLSTLKERARKAFEGKVESQRHRLITFRRRLRLRRRKWQAQHRRIRRDSLSQVRGHVVQAGLPLRTDCIFSRAFRKTALS